VTGDPPSGVYVTGTPALLTARKQRFDPEGGLTAVPLPLSTVMPVAVTAVYAWPNPRDENASARKITSRFI
jgi:hypothetical protein